jgi:hypothetical protein
MHGDLKRREETREPATSPGPQLKRGKSHINVDHISATRVTANLLYAQLDARSLATSTKAGTLPYRY